MILRSTTKPSERFPDLAEGLVLRGEGDRSQPPSSVTFIESHPCRLAPTCMPRQPLRIALHVCCSGARGARGALELAPQAGIDWLEVPIRTAGYLSRSGDDPLVTDESSLAEVAEVVSEVSDRGLAIAAVPCPTGPLHRPGELARAVKKLQLAARLGAPLITCDVGEAPDEEEQRRLVTHLRELGAAADGEGVLVALEFGRGFTRNHRYLQYLLREVEHPRIRACFDPGLLHSLNDEIYSEVSLAKICHLVKHCRWRDFDGVSGSREFPPPGLGSGCINFVRMHQILRDAGYRGAWSLAIETNSDISLEPHQMLERIRNSLGYLKRIGALDPY